MGNAIRRRLPLVPVQTGKEVTEATKTENAVSKESWKSENEVEKSCGHGETNILRADVDADVLEKWQKEQADLKNKVILEDAHEWCLPGSENRGEKREPLKLVGGVDISFVKGDNVNACAALVVISFPEMEVVYEDCTMVELTAPYIPGFLAFREADFLVEAMDKLQATAPQYMPQVIMVDGNGTLHPKEFGLACHLGVLLDMPCLGVAKNLYYVDGLERNADHAEKIKQLRTAGDTFPLVGNSGHTLGMALRSCDSSTNPVYISPGHRITMDTAVEVVRQCCRYRVPEPTRQADIRSREYLRKNFKPLTDPGGS